MSSQTTRSSNLRDVVAGNSVQNSISRLVNVTAQQFGCGSGGLGYVCTGEYHMYVRIHTINNTTAFFLLASKNIKKRKENGNL